MSIPIQIRLAENQVKIIDSLVQKKIFRSRTRAIEQFIQESLEKRDLINYNEMASEQQN